MAPIADQIKKEMQQPFCECGCGERVPPPEKYRPQKRFIFGHAQRINAKAVQHRCPYPKKCGRRALYRDMGDPV